MTQAFLPDQHTIRLRDPWVWLFPLCSALLLALLYFSGANLYLFLDINHAAADLPESIWRHLTVLGDTLVALSLLLPFVGRKPQLVWACIIAGVFTALFVQGIKWTLAVPRPSAILNADIFHLIGPRLASVYSFPSGHTATVFLLASIVSLYFRRLLIAVPLLLAALLVSVSRIAVGVHWPLDVVGGVFFAWICSVAGLYLSTRWTWGLTVIGQRVLAIFLIVVAIYTALFHNAHYDTRLFQILLITLIMLLSVNRVKALFAIGRNKL